jgi:aspartate ammonia-lyase
MDTRNEHDLLGELAVPAHAYWGVHTQRALENFPITGLAIGRWPALVNALAAVKQAAAEANHALGLLDAGRAGAIVQACMEIRAGRWHEQFVVDVIQGGAGTSTNMNANEVIANRALELLGHGRGQYALLHPNEHVNLGQSTNDVYPTALKLALLAMAEELLASMEVLRRSFQAKREEFADVLKVGRTQLQDAVPMTLGQEFGTYAVMMEEDMARLREGMVFLREINLGATAIGTGLNAHPGYAAQVAQRLGAIVGTPLVTASDLIESTQDCGVFVHVSAMLKRVAVKLGKVCNDLRLISSGPRAGLGEIALPPRQAGSSIMPGKVNPVIPEVVNQICFEVIGNDLTVTLAAQAGQLQLNAFEPVIASSLFRSFQYLSRGMQVLACHCVDGIRANEALLRQQVEHSIGLATALNPHIGYVAATEVALEAQATGDSVVEVVLRRGLLESGQLLQILRPEVLARPNA